jgi:hypothetical protein
MQNINDESADNVKINPKLIPLHLHEHMIYKPTNIERSGHDEMKCARGRDKIMEMIPFIPQNHRSRTASRFRAQIKTNSAWKMDIWLRISFTPRSLRSLRDFYITLAHSPEYIHSIIFSPISLFFHLRTDAAGQ